MPIEGAAWAALSKVWGIVMKRNLIAFESDAQIDRVVAKERRRLQRLRGKDAGKSAAIRALILRGSKTRVNPDA